MAINPSFYNLKQEKQERIINAGIKEFVTSGFDKSSTNAIVEEAGISKGSLFNYFNNKKELYLFLLDYSLQVVDKIIDDIDLKDGDLFNRIHNIGIRKLYVQMEFPHLFDLLTAAVAEDSETVREAIKVKLDPVYSESQKRLYENIDYSLFREDVDVEKAIEILNWTMTGYGDKTVRQLNSFEDLSEFGERYLEEWERYSEILKYSFYK